MSSIDVCDRVGPLVEAYRDGLLVGHDHALVAAHLSTCASCADDELALRAGTLFPGHRIDARAVAREGRWRERPVLRLDHWRRRAFAAAAAAVVVVAVSASVSLGTRPELLGEGSTSGSSAGSGGSGRVAPATAKPISLEVLTERDAKLKVGKPVGSDASGGSGSSGSGSSGSGSSGSGSSGSGSSGSGSK